jgi:hypothetical protein
MADRPQKKLKDPSRKKQAGRAKDERRAASMSDVKVEQFLTGRLPEANVRAGLQLGQVTGVIGGSKFEVMGEDGIKYENVGLKMGLRLGSHRRAGDSDSFIGKKTYVLFDGDTISAKMSDEDVRYYMTRKGAGVFVGQAPRSGSGSGSSRGSRRSRGSGSGSGTRRSRGSSAGAANGLAFGVPPEGFEYANTRKNKKALEKLATRKAAHATAKQIQKNIREAQKATHVGNLYAEKPMGEYVLVAAKPPPREGPRHVEQFGYRSTAANRNQAVANFFAARMANAAGGIGNE